MGLLITIFLVCCSKACINATSKQRSPWFVQNTTTGIADEKGISVMMKNKPKMIAGLDEPLMAYSKAAECSKELKKSFWRWMSYPKQASINKMLRTLTAIGTLKFFYFFLCLPQNLIAHCFCYHYVLLLLLQPFFDRKIRINVLKTISDSLLTK
jgi:hypothetical protein